MTKYHNIPYTLSLERLWDVEKHEIGKQYQDQRKLDVFH